MIKQIICIEDKEGNFIFEIDFQETPQSYRVRRMKQLNKRYPTNEYRYV